MQAAVTYHSTPYRKRLTSTKSVANAHSGYIFGFQNQEMDDEIKGDGNSYDFGARIHDPRLGRWLSCDPKEKKYPYLSPYHFTANNPIIFVDKDGNDHIIFTQNTITTRTVLKTADKEVVTTSFVTTYSSEVIKAEGPDVYSFNRTSENITKEKPENGVFFEETSHTYSNDGSTELHPDDMNAQSGVTKSVSGFCDGLFGSTFGDYDRATVGKFMLRDETFSEYMTSRNPNAASWKTYANALEWSGALSKVTQTISLAYFGGLIADVAVTANGGNMLKPLGLGSTGRTAATNLTEQLAMKEAMSNPAAGQIIERMKPLKDPRWSGWRKMQFEHVGLDGSKTIIHYNGKWENGVLKAVDDFKFK